MKIKFIITLLISTCLLLSSCATRERADAMYDDHLSTLHEKKQDFINDKVHVHEGSYSTEIPYGTVIPKKINLHFKDENIKDILNTAFPNKAVIHDLDTTELSKKYSLSYDGNQADFPQYISVTTNLHIHEDENFIYIEEMQSVLFDIHFIYGKTDFIIGEVNPFTAAERLGSKISISGSDVAKSFLPDDGHDNDLDGILQFSRDQKAESIWTELDKSLKKYVSPKGHYEISETNSIVTINDKPRNIMQIKRFLDEYNESLSKQVLMKIKVIEVSFDDASQRGVDWALFYESADNFFKSTGNSALSSNVIGEFDQLTSSISFGRQAGDLAWSIMYKSLEEQGKVTIQSEPMLSLLNSQPGSIKVESAQSYLSETKAVQQQTSTSQELVPAVIVTGFNAYLLPNIVDDMVILQITVSLSDLIDIRTFEASDRGDKIQLPETHTNQFTQRLILKDRTSTLLSIFSESGSTTSDKGLYNNDPLGASGSRVHRNEILVLITPIIAHYKISESSTTNKGIK